MDYNEIIKECYSISDFCKKMGLSINGYSFNKIKLIIDENKLDISHFDNGLSKKTKHIVINKECPVCNTIFTTKCDTKEKTVCSKACSNTYFRSGINSANYKDINLYDHRSRQFAIKYRKICFDNHIHKCVICNESKLLDVHHFDEDKFNNKPDNLIPICATHHNYLHSKYKDEIYGKVIEYRNNFVKNNASVL